MTRVEAEARARRMSGLMDEGENAQRSESSVRPVSPRLGRGGTKVSASGALVSLGN